MKCSECEILISAYADGELDGPDRAEVEAHISHCAVCKQLCDETMQLQRDLTSVLAECSEIPDLVAAVSSRIRPQPRVRFAWAWAAAIVVLVAILGYHLAQSLPHGKPAAVVARTGPKPAVKRNLIANGSPTQPERVAPTRVAGVKRPSRRTAYKAATSTVAKHSPGAAHGTNSLPQDNPSSPAAGAAEVAVEYVDAMPVARGRLSSPPPPLAAIASGRRVVADIEVVMENGKRVERLCYLIIENDDGNGNTEKQSKGDRNETN